MAFNNRPKLQPNIRTVDTKGLVRLILIYFATIIGVGGISSLVIIANCCSANLKQFASPWVIWEVDAPVYLGTLFLALVWTSAVVFIKVDQGKWRMKQEEMFDKYTQFAYLWKHDFIKHKGKSIRPVTKLKYDPVDLPKMEAMVFRVKVVFLIMMVAIILLPEFVPRHIITFTITGVITGISTALLGKTIQELFLDIQTKNNRSSIVTQQSLQRFLETNYGPEMESLLAEARKAPKQWRKQVYTHEGLETWAKETHKKLGHLPRP